MQKRVIFSALLVSLGMIMVFISSQLLPGQAAEEPWVGNDQWEMTI